MPWCACSVCSSYQVTVLWVNLLYFVIVFVKSYFPHWTTNFLSCSGLSCFLVFGRKFEMGEKRVKCVHLIQYLAKQMENSSATRGTVLGIPLDSHKCIQCGVKAFGAGRGLQNKPSKLRNDVFLSVCDLASLNRIYVLMCQRLGLHETEDPIFLGFIPLLLRYHLH